MMVPLIDGPRFRLRVSLFLPILWMAALVTGRSLTFAVTFACVTLHELSHAAVLWALRCPISRMDLTPMGAFLATDAELEQNPGTEAAAAFAGPAFNLALAAGLEILTRRGILFPFSEAAIQVNLMLACFNLLPALPLDGGHILRAALTRVTGLGRASRITAGVGFALAAGIAALTALVWFRLRIAHPEWLLMSLLLVTHSLRTLRSAAWLGIRSGEMRRRELLSRGLLPIRHVVLSPETRIAELLPRLAPRSYHIFLVVDEDGQTLGSFSEEHLISHLHRKNPVTAGEILSSGACGIFAAVIQYTDSIQNGFLCPCGCKRRFPCKTNSSRFYPGCPSPPAIPAASCTAS